MITKIYKRVKNKKGVKIPQGRAREGWGKHLHLKSGGAPAKRAEVEARAGREFLFPEPLFLPAPPERKISKVSVGIFAEESSDFVQKGQPICKVSVSRLARGFAPRFGKRIFKQFPIEPTFSPAEGGTQSGNLSRQSQDCPKAI